MLDFVVYSTTTIALWSVLGLSLNLQFGLTGLVNFGQVLPFAIGAYGAGFAAERGGDSAKASKYYAQLIEVATAGDMGISRVDHARAWLAKNLVSRSE